MASSLTTQPIALALATSARGDLGDALAVHVGGGDPGVEREPGEDRGLGGGVEALDVGGRVGLGVAERLASSSASAKPAPLSSIRVRMKLVVPLTMPSTRLTRSPASDSRSGRSSGIAPATAAS